MRKLLLNKNQFSDLLNLHHGVYNPLRHFVNEKTFLDILYKRKLKKFFPLPIRVSKENYNKIKKSTFLKLYFKKKYLAIIKINSFFKINNLDFGRKIFKENFKKHPFFIRFKKKTISSLILILKK